MYSKLMLNKLKVIKNPTFIYTLRDLIQKRFCESFISMCGPWLPMCDPHVAHNCTKSELEVN
jgi:hypothetical protein